MEPSKEYTYQPKQKGSGIVKVKMPNIGKIILVASGKGGVGKSTIAAGLAMSLALEGFSVGMLDADIYGPSIPTLFDLENPVRPAFKQADGKQQIEPLIRYGIKIMSIGFFFDAHQAIIWRGPMVTKGLTQMMTETNWGNLDYLIVDTPPGTGDVHITLLQEFELFGVVAVTTPQRMALSDVQKAISLFRDKLVGTRVLGIVENMSWFIPSAHPNEKYYLFGKGGGEALSNFFDIPLLAQIPINERICEACDQGKLAEMFRDEYVKDSFEKLVKRIMD